MGHIPRPALTFEHLLSRRDVHSPHLDIAIIPNLLRDRWLCTLVTLWLLSEGDPMLAGLCMFAIVHSEKEKEVHRLAVVHGSNL